jgi:prepilin-type processing-associated H-X9-DG protein
MTPSSDPANVNPYEPSRTAETPPTTTGGFKLWHLLAVVGVLSVIVGLLLPTVRINPETPRRTVCANNLKRITLALQNYADEHGGFPPRYTVDENGRPLHSWRTLILPYMEEQALYDKIDLTKPWDDPANAEARATVVHTYSCPSQPLDPGKTAYLAIASPQGMLQPGEKRSLASITDGTANTIAVIEVPAEHAVHWMSPTDASEAVVLGMNSKSKLPHPGGAHAAMGDGRVQFLSADLPAETRLRLMRSDDGLPVGDF